MSPARDTPAATADPKRSLPIAPSPRSPWQTLLGACAKTLSAANPIALSRPPIERLDARMAQAIRHNDAARFESLLTQALDAVERPLGPPLPLTGAPAPTQSLTAAIETGGAYYLERLVKAGASPDSPAFTPAHQRVFNEESLLHRAVRIKNLSMATLLIDLGAKLDSGAHFNGSTPLAVAVSLGWREISLALIDAGSPLDALDSGGQSPLQRALPYLPDQDPLCSNARPSHGEALLQRLKQGAPIARALLKAGARASVCPPQSAHSSFPPPLPPLAAAIRIGDSGLAELLITAGADTSWLFPAAGAPMDPRAADWAAQAERDPAARLALVKARTHAQLIAFRDAQSQALANCAASIAAVFSTPPSAPALPAPPPRESPRSILASRRGAP